MLAGNKKIIIITTIRIITIIIIIIIIIITTILGDLQWIQASLPIQEGGLGISHGLSCKRSIERSTHHQQINDLISLALKRSDVLATKNQWTCSEMMGNALMALH